MKYKMGVFITVLLVALGTNVAAQPLSESSVTRDTVLAWARQFAAAEPGFEPGASLSREEVEQARPFLPPGRNIRF